MKEFNRLLWIRLKADNENTKPLLVGVRGEYMHWDAGTSYCMWEPEKVVIVREFPCEDYSSIERARHELLVEFAPKPQAPSARLGFISPEGHYYPCGYCCHQDLQSILGELIYKENCYCDLEREHGWIGFKGSGIFSQGFMGKKPTQAQLDTMRKIVEESEILESENPDFNWSAYLWENVEGYNIQSGWSDPSKFGFGDEEEGSYAKQLRERFELLFGERESNATVLVTPSLYQGDLRVKRPNDHPGD